MNITQLIAKYRYDAGDTEEDYLVSDAELIDLFNEAVDEACTRKELLFDATTAAVCNIAVTVGTPSYSLHESIVCINKAYLINASGTYTYLYLYARDVMDLEDSEWRESTESPTRLVVDEGRVQLSGPPREDATLHLEVRRVPLDTERMIEVVDPAPATSPVIQSTHHKFLHHYPLSIVFGRDDADYYAPDKAMKHDALFNWHFGDPVTAKEIQAQKLTRPTHRWLGWP